MIPACRKRIQSLMCATKRRRFSSMCSGPIRRCRRRFTQGTWHERSNWAWRHSNHGNARSDYFSVYPPDGRVTMSVHTAPKELLCMLRWSLYSGAGRSALCGWGGKSKVPSSKPATSAPEPTRKQPQSSIRHHSILPRGSRDIIFATCLRQSSRHVCDTTCDIWATQ